MAEAIIKLLSGLAYQDIILTMLLVVGIVSVSVSRRVLNRIRLAEFKHIATIYAMELEFKNGFTTAYHKKLGELKAEHKFMTTGE